MLFIHKESPRVNWFRLMALTVLFGLAACGGAAAQAPTPMPPPNPETVMVTVNGQPIRYAEFERWRARRVAGTQPADMTAVDAVVLTEMINQILTEQGAAEMGIRIEADAVDAQITELQALVEGDDAAWANWLAANGYTEPELRADIRNQLLTEAVVAELTATLDPARTIQVHARHILVDTEAQAEEIRAQLLAGESFVDLAARFSKDVTTREEGGDLGWFTRDELLEPVVAEVAFGQSAGDISQPVPTRLGWHIIETLEFDDAPLQPEKQAQVAQVIFDEWLTTLNDSALITYQPES
jgi:peptidyl-prolyl cis-trans isomerase C